MRYQIKQLAESEAKAAEHQQETLLERMMETELELEEMNRV